ncbi:MAG TPA: hypothetical protein VJ810_22935 [Blastocatellia bacterium]|nr:hypothetical protein [Blastocatellia bacterium]
MKEFLLHEHLYFDFPRLFEPSLKPGRKPSLKVHLPPSLLSSQRPQCYDALGLFYFSIFEQIRDGPE